MGWRAILEQRRREEALMSTPSAPTLLSLLQLASPALPVGAYSYSEGLEWLIQQGQIAHRADLAHWLTQALTHGTIRLEAAIMVRAFRAYQAGETARLLYWNDWLSATRETAELRQQSWQMGRSLLRLLAELEPTAIAALPAQLPQASCNFAVSFAIAAACWDVPLPEATLAYLQSWAANLTSAGVRLVPLGQTEGQRLLRQLAPTLQTAAAAVQHLEDEALMSCSWGLSLASMGHENQYSRLFRS